MTPVSRACVLFPANFFLLFRKESRAEDTHCQGVCPPEVNSVAYGVRVGVMIFAHESSVALFPPLAVIRRCHAVRLTRAWYYIATIIILVCEQVIISFYVRSKLFMIHTITTISHWVDDLKQPANAGLVTFVAGSTRRYWCRVEIAKATQGCIHQCIVRTILSTSQTRKSFMCHGGMAQSKSGKSKSRRYGPKKTGNERPLSTVGQYIALCLLPLMW